VTPQPLFVVLGEGESLPEGVEPQFVLRLIYADPTPPDRP